MNSLVLNANIHLRSYVRWVVHRFHAHTALQITPKKIYPCFRPKAPAVMELRALEVHILVVPVTGEAVVPVINFSINRKQ